MREKKVLRNLRGFVKDEQRSLRRIRSLKHISTIGGLFILLACFTLAFQEDELLPCWILTFAAALAGSLLGLGIWFDSTIKTWPVMRRFVDFERLLDERDDG